MKTKRCTKCGIKKPINDFRMKTDNRQHKKYIYSQCKECEKVTTRKYKEKYYEQNKELVKEKSRQQRLNNHEEYIQYMKNYYQDNKDELSQKNKEYVEKHKEKTKQYQREYSESHKEIKKEYDKEYFIKNKEKIIKRMYDKYLNDDVYRFKQKIRNVIRSSFTRKGYTKKSHTYEIIGVDYETFKEHLLKSYKDTYGVDWDGVELVHIDHIIPLATAETEEDVIKLCHYTNLQLLKGEDNLSKGANTEWQYKE